MQSYIRTIIIFNSKIFPLKFYKSTVNNSYIMLNLSKKYIMLVKIPNDLFIIVFKNKFLCFSKKFITLKLFKSLIFNKAILNYFFSWSVSLYLFGWAFKFFELSSKKIILRLGFSHKLILNFNNIKIKKSKLKKNCIIMTSNDKCKLFNTVSVLRKFKHPDIYKGRGVRFFWEILKFKKINN